MAYKTYNARDWYWIVASSSTQVYSSAQAMYVAVADATYQNWLTQPPDYLGQPTNVATEAQLWAELAIAYPAGIAASNVAGQQAIKDAAKPGVFQTLQYVKGIDVTVIDMNTLKTPGFYIGYVMTNGPSGPGSSNDTYYIEVQAWANTNYVLQLAARLEVGAYDVWHRTYTGTWGPWRRFVISPHASPVSLTDTTPSTSTTTGALMVAGGVGVVGSIYAGAVTAQNVTGQYIIASVTVGYGYGGAGTGGTVTQAGSITTTVALNKLAGEIVTVSSTLAAAGEATFSVSNSNAFPGTAIVVWIRSYTGTGTPVVDVTGVRSNVFDITITNLHASAALNAPITIGFMCLSAPTS